MGEVAAMNPAQKRLGELRDAFRKAHQEGMDGLASKNYGALGDAIQRERVIIEEQKALLDEEIGKLKDLPVPTRTRK